MGQSTALSNMQRTQATAMQDFLAKMHENQVGMQQDIQQQQVLNTNQRKI